MDYRVERLQECFNPFTGWRHCFASMTDFLEDCILQFQDVDNDDMSFLKFVQTRFKVIASSLRDCISIFCTHVSRSVLKYNFENMSCLMSLIDSFQSLLFENWVESEELERVFSSDLYACGGSLFNKYEELLMTKNDCIVVLKSVQQSMDLLGLPQTTNKRTICEFLFSECFIVLLHGFGFV